MSAYIDHLGQMYSDKSFKRKVDYIKFNFSGYLKQINKNDFYVLEIGPGMGEFIYYLNKLGVKNIDIVDNDKTIIAHNKKNFKIRNSYLSDNFLKIDKKFGDYNLIIMIQVLEHIPVEFHQPIIKTLFEHLKKDGSLVIVVPNANNPLGIVERYGDIQHYTSFTSQSLQDLVGYSNLKNAEVSIRGFKIPSYTLINLIRIISQRTLHLFLFLMLVINGGIYFRVLTPNILLSVKKLR